MAAHATRLGEKLRRERLDSDHVGVFFHTSEHDTGAPQRSAATTVSLAEATSDTLALVRTATVGVRQVWRPGYRYSKAGVVTVDLVQLEASQRALPRLGQADCTKTAALTAELDHCNGRYGRGTVVVAAAGLVPAPGLGDEVRNALAARPHLPRRAAGGRAGLAPAHEPAPREVLGKVSRTCPLRRKPRTARM